MIFPKLHVYALTASSLLAISAASRVQIPLSREPLQDIPLLGFGTWNLDRNNASDVVSEALNAGFRHFDCAAIYRDEREVGTGLRKGLKSAGLKREDIWVTSKLWNNHHSPSLVPKALNETLTDLDTPYLDLYLMHWPVSSENGRTEIDYLDTWHAMIKLVEAKLVRHIGVSNFSPSQLHALIESAPDNPPFAHQMEVHPYLQQKGFVDWHRLNNIHITAYSPLGNMNPTYTTWRKAKSAEAVPPLLSNGLMREIAETRSCTPAQVALQWGRSRGTSVILKSAHTQRIKENYASLQCNLEPEDIQRIESQLPTKRFNNPSASWGVDLYDGLEDATSSAELGSSTLMTTSRMALEDAWNRLRTLGNAIADLQIRTGPESNRDQSLRSGCWCV
ncbi:MAG: hypothetical protein M1828_002368 [Chrysothrix sp. TS-e1954]|nr:MAG: hypothetical protein M1828_002368 [Chrysothrix sp. TS-e1954]